MLIDRKSWKLAAIAVVMIAVIAGSGCKKKHGDAFPASNAVAGWQKASETRVFVACFDSRRVFVYDPQRSRIETEILTGRGPHAMVVDSSRRLLYVGHFTDSYVGVYSLDLASPATYGTLLGTLGTPKPPRTSK